MKEDEEWWMVQRFGDSKPRHRQGCMHGGSAWLLGNTAASDRPAVPHVMRILKLRSCSTTVLSLSIDVVSIDATLAWASRWLIWYIKILHLQKRASSTTIFLNHIHTAGGNFCAKRGRTNWYQELFFAATPSLLHTTTTSSSSAVNLSRW